jgi:hypothetical protein
MRYLSTIALVVAGFLGVAIFAAPRAQAVGPPIVPQNQLAAASDKLTQQSTGTWTTTVYVDTGALCPVPVSFNLLTTTPYSDTADARPQYAGGSPQCGAQAAHPVTEVNLTFTPSPELTSVPQSATLALTPSPAALSQGVVPLDLQLTVRRQVSAWQYVWLPVICGLVLALALIGLTAIGVPRPRDPEERVTFWRMPLYASSAWTFRDSWATNVTALGAVAGTALTASGSIAELFPGLELGRFSLVIAIAGAITVIAPLSFGVLNYRFSRQDPSAAQVVSIGLTTDADPGECVTIDMPAGGSITLHAPASGQDTTIDVPVGEAITIAPLAGQPATGTQCKPLLVLAGGTDIAVGPGQQVTVGAGQPQPAPVGANISFLGKAKVTLPAHAYVAAPADTPAEAPARKMAGSWEWPKALAARWKRAKAPALSSSPPSPPSPSPPSPPSPSPPSPPSPSPPSPPAQRVFTLPRDGNVVAAQMQTMLIASGLTVFGIGAELGVMGVVLGFNLAVAPGYARDLALAAALVLAALLLWYGVIAIRALTDSRDGSPMSNAGNSSFIL